MHTLSKSAAGTQLGRTARAVLAGLALFAMTATALAQQVGGHFVVGRAGTPTNLDPHKTGEAAADEILGLLGGSLLVADPVTNELRPSIAESYELADDGVTYTLRLRNDVKFHNGDPLTAADYKYTFERALDPETQATVSGDLLGGVASIEVPDDHTLVITLTEPSAIFLRNLTNGGYLQPLSRRAVEEQGDNYGVHPVSVGMYRFKDWVAGFSITLERNPDFAWAPYYLANQGTAYPDEIEFRSLPEQGTLVAALEAGEVDYADVPAVDLFLFEDNPNFQLYSTLESGLGLEFFFNMNDPVMADLRVRQAISHAIDKEFFIDRVVDGLGVPATGVLPPTIAGYDPESVESTYAFDREAAGALLDEAGWELGANGVRQKDGEPLTVRIVSDNTPNLALGSELLQNQLRAIGIDAQLENYDRSLWLPMLAGGDFQVAPLSWTYDDPDIGFFLTHSSQNPSGLNFGAINDPELDALLEEGRSTLDDAARLLVYHDVQRLINERAYRAPVLVKEVFSAAANRVHDVRFDSSGFVFFGDVWLDN